ncbi:cGMP-dependent protein kinase 1-like isoform X2 [Rhynchophorus ferrugineus]|uniref:cGMP-dependent protein kinase 1-like isoform X2 n=1 Tax=Rhynchophorus ferrugineus TaxID=354439 RepID=UPI003FCED73A
MLLCNFSMSVCNRVTFGQSERKDIFQVLFQNEFLKDILSESYMEQLIDLIYVKDLNEGDYLLRENQFFNSLYIWRNGTLEITGYGRSGEKCKHTRLFGDVSILHPSKSSQTIKALEKSSVWVLDSIDFKEVKINQVIERQDEIVKFLKNIPVIQDAPNERLYKLADLFKKQKFEESKILIREGDFIELFLIVTAGSATVLSRPQTNNGEKKLYRGDFFGEKIFHKETPSLHTVIVDSPGLDCFVLSKETFLDYFHDINDLLRKNTDSHGNYLYVELNQLKRIKTLGRGGFGKVELVQDSKNKDNFYALKSLRKAEIVGKSQIDQIFNEKKLQMLCDSYFIVKLYQTFKDPKYMYFLQEACMGGDLWNLLRRQKRKYFDTDTAKFYSACVIEAFNYLHSRDIVYRDLKPENVMVCADGYVKITDFGFAKRIGPHDRAFSFVGTAEYISPEVIQSHPQGKGVDYWALGIFIYELLVGQSPFRNSEHNDEKTYKAILKGIDFVSFPFTISPRARNLIKKLCRPLAVDRLGCQKDGVKDIEKHSWFSKMDWVKLRSRELEPPIRICLNGKSDTRYFDCVKDKSPEVALDDFGTWDGDF